MSAAFGAFCTGIDHRDSTLLDDYLQLSGLVSCCVPTGPTAKEQRDALLRVFEELRTIWESG